MIIYQIRLPKAQDVEAFVRFMREEYFPAVHKGPTRVGEVENLRLLERSNLLEGDDVTNEFFLHVGWSGLRTGEVRLDDETVVRKLEAFMAAVKHIGYYEEVATWDEREAA